MTKTKTVVLAIAVVAAVGTAAMGVASASNHADQVDGINETDHVDHVNETDHVDETDDGNETVNGSYDTGQDNANVSLPEIDGHVPKDLDDDGVHEDVNGNDRVDSDDVVTLFENIETPEVAENPELFDVNDNARVDFDDVVGLFERL